MTIYIFAAGIAVGALVASIEWAVWCWQAMKETT